MHLGAFVIIIIALLETQNDKNAGIDRMAMDNYINIQCLVYPPELFAEKGIVDIITLYAQYSDLPDECVQIALDETIKEALNG